MGSNRIEANTGEFSARINGLVTQKPCGASKQIASLDSAEPRRNSQSVFQLDPAWRVRASEFLPDEELIPSIATLAEEMTLTERMTGIPVVPCAVPVAKAPELSLEQSGLNNEYFPKSEEAAALKRGRVLLLESDPFCRAIVADCLAENGYMVVAVCDPEEALGEMASGEFAFLLYDPRMPGMSAGKFYHSIIRIKPELSERFVFMLDTDDDAGANRFIRKTDGFVLRKPFDMLDLLDALFSAEDGGKFGHIVRRASLDPIFSKIPLLDYTPSGLDLPAPQPSVAAKNAPVPPAPVAVKPLPVPRPVALPEITPHSVGRGFQRVLALAALALFFGLVAGGWSRYADARDRFEATSAQRVAFTTEWTDVSRRLEEAKSLLSNITRPETQMSVFRTKERWTPVLDSIIPNADAMIDILEVEARGETETSDAWEVRVHGLAGGSDPKMDADRFRQKVGKNLKTTAHGRAVRTRFEPLGDKNGEFTELEQYEFILVVTLSPLGSTVAAAGERR